MKRSDVPAKHSLPFAMNGTRNTIPKSSNTAGAASLTKGFPDETMTPIIAGGIPPDGKDMNGVLHELSAMGRWANAGAEYTFDPDFSSTIGGYPAGARLLSSDGKSVFISAVDDNTANPETVSDKWVGFSNYRGAITVTSGVKTLSAQDASHDLIVLSGALTGNVQLVFPAWVKHWQVINSTTGNFSLTCKTASGSGVVVKAGFLTDIYGDGTSIGSHANTDVAGVVRSVNTHEPDANGNVKLGTAADKDATTSSIDTIKGHVMVLGDRGIGGDSISSIAPPSTVKDAAGVMNFLQPYGGGQYYFNAGNNISGFPGFSLGSFHTIGKSEHGMFLVVPNSGDAYAIGMHAGVSYTNRLYGTLNPPKPEDINAVKKTGDTMTGSLDVDGKISLSDGLEIGNQKAPSPAYIDFHTDGAATDYNARIISPQGTTELNLIAADNANNGSGIVRLLGSKGDALSFALQGTARDALAWRKWGSNERPTVLELDVDGGAWLINIDHTPDDKAALGVNGVLNCEGVNVGGARMAADGNIWGTRWNPNGGWLWDAIVAQIQNVGQMSVNGTQWWAKINMNGGTLIVQGGYAEVRDAETTDRIGLNIAVPNRLLGVFITNKNFAQGYATYNPQVTVLDDNTGFNFVHGQKERMMYWIAVGY